MKKFLLLFFLLLSSWQVYSQDTGNETKERIFFQNKEIEPWAFKMGIDGMIIDLSQWSSNLALKHTSGLNSLSFGLGG